MVKIRLRRMGSKRNPYYRIIVADSRSPRNGRFIQEIGRYNPVTEPVTFEVDGDKAREWIANGAQPTATIDRLFKEKGIYDNTEAVTEEQEELDQE